MCTCEPQTQPQTARQKRTLIIPQPFHSYACVTRPYSLYLPLASTPTMASLLIFVAWDVEIRMVMREMHGNDRWLLNVIGTSATVHAAYCFYPGSTLHVNSPLPLRQFPRCITSLYELVHMCRLCRVAKPASQYTRIEFLYAMAHDFHRGRCKECMAVYRTHRHCCKCGALKGKAAFSAHAWKTTDARTCTDMQSQETVCEVRHREGRN